MVTVKGRLKLTLCFIIAFKFLTDNAPSYLCVPRTDHSHQPLPFVMPLVTGFIGISSLECLSVFASLGSTPSSSDSQPVVLTGVLPNLCCRGNRFCGGQRDSPGFLMSLGKGGSHVEPGTGMFHFWSSSAPGSLSGIDTLSRI